MENQLDMTNAIDQQQWAKNAANKDRKWVEEHPEKCPPKDFSKMRIERRNSRMQIIYFKRV